jgi:LysR family transcriptional regulator, regulator for bpeEF and oprC
MSNNQNFGKINLNHLPVFAAIAESKSLTEAARSLGSDKTRVSRILTELESDLDAELVYRTTRDLRLTEAGQLFDSRCREILSNLEEATNQLSHKGTEVSGHICLTAAHGVASALLPIAIKDFSKLYPQVTFQIILTQQSLNLVKEGIDIALRVGRLEDSSYKVRKIGNVHFAFAATPLFLSSSSPVRKIEDLGSARTITFPHFNKKPLVFKCGGEEARVKLGSAIVCNSPDVILGLTLQEMGIALIPEFICRDHFKTGQLIRVFENWSLEPAPISLLFHTSTRKTTPVSLFIAFLSNYFGGLLR